MTNFQEIDLSKTYNGIRHLTFPDASRKPHGLWYAENYDWVRWCHSEMPQWIKPNIFELEIDMDKILILSNVRSLRLFNIAYGTSFGGFLCIDWGKVKKEYKGIEIHNYHRLRRNHDEFGFWFYGWDVSGGCIWDLSAIKNIKKYLTPKRFITNN